MNEHNINKLNILAFEELKGLPLVYGEHGETIAEMAMLSHPTLKAADLVRF